MAPPMKPLRFTTLIRAPRQQVWQTMIDPEAYRDWTAPFIAGSAYEGSWEPGARIRFVDPEGNGMLAEIAEHQPGEFVSIRHLGTIADGVEDTTSDAVRRWAPAYENYRFIDEGDATRVEVTMDSLPEIEDFMQRTWPVALARLKARCEGAG